MGTGFDIATAPEEEGIIPRAVTHLFEGIDRRKHDAKERNEPQPDFKVTVQFMEVRAKKNHKYYFNWGWTTVELEENHFGDDLVILIWTISIELK